jgi:hypothetical protein
LLFIYELKTTLARGTLIAKLRKKPKQKIQHQRPPGQPFFRIILLVFIIIVAFLNLVDIYDLVFPEEEEIPKDGHWLIYMEELVLFFGDILLLRHLIEKFLLYKKHLATSFFLTSHGALYLEDEEEKEEEKKELETHGAEDESAPTEQTPFLQKKNLEK